MAVAESLVQNRLRPWLQMLCTSKQDCFQANLLFKKRSHFLYRTKTKKDQRTSLNKAGHSCTLRHFLPTFNDNTEGFNTSYKVSSSEGNLGDRMVAVNYRLTDICVLHRSRWVIAVGNEVESHQRVFFG